MTESIIKPMLASKLEADDFKSMAFPILMSPKLDGIRCLKVNGKALSRKFKSIPNHFIRNWVEENLPDGMDGELFIRGANFNQIQSGVMSQDGEPDFYLAAFDLVKDGLNLPYKQRYKDLEAMISSVSSEVRKHLELVEHKMINNHDELAKYEQWAVDNRYEGAMVRSLNGPYKNGRSTVREGFLLKIKRYQDGEAEVIGFDEMMHNENVEETDELGHTKRSSCAEGIVPAGTLGDFIVRDLKTGAQFQIGTGKGLTLELRQKIWDNRNKYMGKIVKYKFQEYGGKNLPRFPVWLGFRDKIDL